MLACALVPGRTIKCFLWGRLVRKDGPKPASSFVRLLSDRRMLVSKVPGRRLPAEGWDLGCLAADIRSGLRRNLLLVVRLVAVVRPLMVVGDRDPGLPLGGPRRRGNNRQRNNSSQKLQHCIS